MLIRIILSLVIIAGALFFFLQDRSVEKIEVIRPVKVLKLKPTKSSNVRTFNGIARSDVAATLSFSVSGTVKKVYVKAGQNVKKGDLIASIDSTYLRLKVDEVKASLKRAESEYKHAKNSYDRIQRLYVHNNASLSDLENSRTHSDSAKAQLTASKNRLQQVRLELDHTKLRAPMKGSISTVNIRKSENITTATPVATISSTKTIEVPVSIPGSLIDSINEGLICTVTFDALKGKKFKARVTEVSHSTSMKTTTFPVKVRLVKANSRIHPGMSASVRFEFKSAMSKGGYVVPAHAVMEDSNGRFVFLAKTDDNDTAHVIRQNVELGKLTANGIIITKGVRKGMYVITAGMTRLHENQIVKAPTK